MTLLDRVLTIDTFGLCWSMNRRLDGLQQRPLIALTVSR
jgi:hypothetical protein